MNKQSFYLLGGALLASTALTTAANAAIIVQNPGIGPGPAPATTAFAGYNIASEVFSTTASTANSVVIAGGTNTANNGILIDFTAQLTSSFNVQLNVTNASFTGTPSTVVYYQTTNGTLEASSATGCSIQPLPDKLLITGCTVGTAPSVLSRVDAMGITGIQFISAGALVTAGQSIKLDGIVTDSSRSVTYENITQVVYITSKSAGEASVVADGAVTIDNNATPAFSVFVTPTAGAVATLGSVHYSGTGVVGTDLSNAYTSAASIVGTSEVKIASSLLSDPALVSISVSGATATTKTAGDFVSGTVSFQVPAAALNGATITATFNGTSAILASTGTSTATVTPTKGGTPGLARSTGAFSGTLATVSRGGLSVELNTLQPTAGLGSTLYRSYLRISNQSALDGVATVTVKNDATGALIGSFTTTITAGGTRQIGSDTIEANISTAVSSGAANYKVTVSGSFNGYVQALMWNSVTGIFSDLSGFRNGALTQDP